VLVLQNLGVSWAPSWHYAVVIGADAGSDHVILRSGTDERRVMRTPVFLRTWKRSGFWAVTTLKPGELPADPDRDRYVEAVAGLEQTGHYQAARDAWRAGRSNWPDDAVIHFGLANTEFDLGNFATAEMLYRDMLSEDSSLLIARNNLAMTLVAMGQVDQALEQIDIALGQAEGSPQPEEVPLLEELRDTKRIALSSVRSTSK
jgi:hypothetical protein